MYVHIGSYSKTAKRLLSLCFHILVNMCILLAFNLVCTCTCVLTCACVCSNSSSFMLFETGTWNTDMLATLLHSDLTLAIATMASSRVKIQLKAKLSNFSSKGYEGTSG